MELPNGIHQGVAACSSQFRCARHDALAAVLLRDGLEPATQTEFLAGQFDRVRSRVLAFGGTPG